MRQSDTESRYPCRQPASPKGTCHDQHAARTQFQPARGTVGDCSQSGNDQGGGDYHGGVDYRADDCGGGCAVDGDGIDDIDEIVGCMDSSACNYNVSATDQGTCEYPIEGYDCEGNSIQVLEIGALMNGGIVFYIDETGQHGLVAALEDIGEFFEWGCYGTSISGADGQAIGTGYQNTMDIVNQGCTTVEGGITAAQAALDAEIDGYFDWYLPSRNELNQMYNSIGYGGLLGNIGGFVGTEYWSSTEYDSNSTWTGTFSQSHAGSVGIWLSNVTKQGYARVRPIRSF